MRSKVLVIIFSVVILVLTALFRTSFYAEPTYSRYKLLTWEDFKGFPILFTGWGAAISSNLFIEYDSASSTYAAYSLMNNHRSWKKLSFEGSDYTLRHEQYHFNLTESFARLLTTELQADSLTQRERTNCYMTTELG